MVSLIKCVKDSFVFLTVKWTETPVTIAVVRPQGEAVRYKPHTGNCVCGCARAR
jgi:hypothetical protein